MIAGNLDTATLAALSGKSHRAPCPACNRGPKDRALSVTVDARGTVMHCFRCGYVATERRPGAPPVPSSPRREALDWSPRADSIWQRTLPLGTVARAYLTCRSCALPPADGDLRFLAAAGGHPPCLCARITDALTGKPISLHFTRLKTDGNGKAGTDRDKVLLSGHRKKGGVVRLWPDEAVTHGLGIADGIETALAAAHVFTPMWAAVDAGNLAELPVLAGIQALTVFADNDPAGRSAARDCAQRWADHCREARIITPTMEQADIADLAAE